MLGLSGTGFFDTETRQFQAVDLAASDVLVVEVPVAKLEEEVDQFTIGFEKTEQGIEMSLRWITTEVRVPMRLP